MKEFIRIGVDLGKRYIQIHALESKDGRAVKRKLPRSKFLEFFADVAPCLIGMEACGSAHYLSLIHISEPTRLGMISYAVFCLKKKKKKKKKTNKYTTQ